MDEPSANGDNGERDQAGRFAVGNRCGRGNPHARRVALFREAMLEAVTPEDVAAVMKALVNLATRGNVAAARELLERVCGRAPQLDESAEAPLIQMYGKDAPVEAV